MWPLDTQTTKHQQNTHTHPFNGPLSGTTQVSRYQKGKTNLDFFLKQETVSGSSISWAICKCASHSRQITMPTSHHSSLLQARCPSCCPTNGVKALKATKKTSTVSPFIIHNYEIAACTHFVGLLMHICVPYSTPSSLPRSPPFSKLGSECSMLPVLQWLGDAYGFWLKELMVCVTAGVGYSGSSADIPGGVRAVACCYAAGVRAGRPRVVQFPDESTARNCRVGCRHHWTGETPLRTRSRPGNGSRRIIKWNTHTHTHTHLTALFQDYPGKPVPER